MEAIKKSPIISGAIPASNELQLSNFLIKKIIAINIEKKLEVKPTKVIALNGIFECLIIPKMPKS
jgi:hypothetical protein